MSSSYRVTKYKKFDENGNLYSSSDEWTSYFDVGEKTSLEEYERIENEYINFVSSVCNFFSIGSLEIKELEFVEDVSEMSSKMEIVSENIPEIIRNILREKIWCKLACDKFEFHFGYDFYMYVISNDSVALNRCIQSVNSSLTVQKYESPYSF